MIRWRNQRLEDNSRFGGTSALGYICFFKSVMSRFGGLGQGPSVSCWGGLHSPWSLVSRRGMISSRNQRLKFVFSFKELCLIPCNCPLACQVALVRFVY